jgi:hypothetical protein
VSHIQDADGAQHGGSGETGMAQHQQAGGNDKETQRSYQGRTIIAEAYQVSLRGRGMSCRNLLLTKDLFRATLISEHFCSFPDLPN